MNIYEILPKAYDIGDGERVAVYVCGCSYFKCPFCFNRMIQDPSAGHKYTEEDKKLIFKYLDALSIKNITILGGEPLDPANLPEVTAVCKELKERYPEINIWVYSGYEYDIIKNLDIIQYIDCLKCGRYIQEYNDGTSVFCGSANQYIVDVKKSSAQNKLIYWHDFEGNPMGPGKYKPLSISSDTELLNELIKAIKNNKSTVCRDSSEYGKGLTAAYGNVLDYYEHLRKIKERIN